MDTEGSEGLTQYDLKPWPDPEDCNGEHPCMLSDGSIINLYDLAHHCQSWVEW